MTTAQTEPKSREIRVFLSSTFKDMDAERNHLIKQVFPKVRAACRDN
jgi:nephrocystin-3